MRIIFVAFIMLRRFWLVLSSSFIPSRYTGLATTTYLNAITYFLIITISSLLISSVGNFLPGFLQDDELESIPDFEIIDGKFMLTGGLKEPYWIDNSSVIDTTGTITKAPKGVDGQGVLITEDAVIRRRILDERKIFFEDIEV